MLRLIMYNVITLKGNAQHCAKHFYTSLRIIVIRDIMIDNTFKKTCLGMLRKYATEFIRPLKMHNKWLKFG